MLILKKNQYLEMINCVNISKYIFIDLDFFFRFVP